MTSNSTVDVDLPTPSDIRGKFSKRIAHEEIEFKAHLVQRLESDFEKSSLEIVLDLEDYFSEVDNRLFTYLQDELNSWGEESYWEITISKVMQAKCTPGKTTVKIFFEDVED